MSEMVKVRSPWGEEFDCEINSFGLDDNDLLNLFLNKLDLEKLESSSVKYVLRRKKLKSYMLFIVEEVKSNGNEIQDEASNMLRIESLSGQQKKMLTEALVKAFPSINELRMLTTFTLDISLDEITTNSSLSSTVFDLILWAESRGNIAKLLLGARDRNPDNPALVKFFRQLTSNNRD